MVSRPDWYPPWVPERDSEGHELGPGLTSLSWENCDCADSRGGGHHVVFCRNIGCRAEPARPSGHVGPGREQR